MNALVAITGASSGIGAAAARAFSEAGHPLLLMARRVARLESLALPDTIVREVDVTDRAAMEAAFIDGESAFGPVDLLINNAGVMPLDPVVDQDAAAWQQLFDVNCVGLLHAGQIALRGMTERRSGTIINLGSIAGKSLYPDHAAYCGSKFAVHAITEGMRREAAAFNVRVLLIAPGMIDTELLASGNQAGRSRADYEAYRESIGGAMSPGYVAETMLMAYRFPQAVCLREIVLAPTVQAV